MARGSRAAFSAAGAVPKYELRVARRRLAELSFEVWQLPSFATPDLRQQRYVGGLSGRNLSLVEYRLFRQLRALGLDIGAARRGEPQRFPLDEAWALRLGLMFRVLAPMRQRGYIKACAEGIEAMPKEEAAYWLGMAMHRRNPRRVLMALRALLTDPSDRRR
jgi:hypothetical protein